MLPSLPFSETGLPPEFAERERWVAPPNQTKTTSMHPIVSAETRIQLLLVMQSPLYLATFILIVAGITLKLSMLSFFIIYYLDK